MTEQRYAIPLSIPDMGGNEARYAAAAISRGDPCQGEYIGRFEQMVADYVGARHAVAVSSGTAALHLALLAAGVGPGDEVIVPALTFIATANAVRYCGAEPVFVDVEPEHWTMDPACLVDRLTYGHGYRVWLGHRMENTDTGAVLRAILPVSILGHPCELRGISFTARFCEIAVVHDATEALGAQAEANQAGSFGNLSCLSFNGNKLITTGGGGMVLTDDAEMAERVRYLANQAKDDPTEYVHCAVGYNYRMSNVAAAVGCAQMERIGQFIEAKRRIAERYAEGLAGVPGIALPREAPWARSNWWLYTVRVSESEYGMSARALRDRLAERSVESRALWQPIHLSPAYSTCYRGPLPVAERLWRTALSLPSSVGLTESDQGRVISAIREFHVGIDIT